MKNGDRIQIAIINLSGRKVETVSTLRVQGTSIFADVTPENSGGALKQKVEINLVPSLIEPTVGNAEFRYLGEIRGAAMVPDMFWK